MFQGSMVALVTPFRHGKVDKPALKRLIEFHIKNKTDVIVPCGTTGESATLSHAEHREVLDYVMNTVKGRLPVICGAGSNSTAEAIELAAHARKLKANGVLMVTPYYNKPTQEGLYRHYATVAAKVDIPIVLYNVPGRTGISISPETVARLAKIPNIVAIKEASGSLDQVSQIRTMVPDFTILSGEDSLTMPMMALGAKGVISVLANVVPQKTTEMVHAALTDDWDRAREMHYHLFPLAKALFVETNPIPVKNALKQMKLISGELRLPLCEMEPSKAASLAKVLKLYQLI